MSIIFRPYQDSDYAALYELAKKYRAILYCLPTGGGKGTVISRMVQNAVAKGKSVIFAVRGLALVNDMSRRLQRLGIKHGVLMGGHKRERWHSVQVASIDTLYRMENQPPCDLIIIDEARTFMSPTGRKVLDSYPKNVKIIGMDATPALISGRGLGVDVDGIFEAMVTGPQEQELIDMGFLSPSIVIGSPSTPDVSGVEKTGGDYNQKQLAEVCDKVKLVGDIVENWLRHGEYRKTLAFGVDRSHAMHIKEQFCAAGCEWEYVDANTPNDEREDIYKRLSHGSLIGLSNVGVCGVGWDCPVISCIIAGRPTASLPLWRQMIGRGGRICPVCAIEGRCSHHPNGKRNFIVLDHAGNTIGHWPYGFFETPPLWTLDGIVRKKKKKGDEDEKGDPISQCKRPVAIPESGVPATFTGPISSDGKFMLPSFHYFKSGPEACPYCGIPLRTAGRTVEVEAGTLVDLSALRQRAKDEGKQKSAVMLAHEERMKSRYLELARIAATKVRKDGSPWSPKWAAMAFHKEFHRWPTKAWKEEAAKAL